MNPAAVGLLLFLALLGVVALFWIRWRLVLHGQRIKNRQRESLTRAVWALSGYHPTERIYKTRRKRDPGGFDL